jgi:hypothetical protein
MIIAKKQPFNTTQVEQHIQMTLKVYSTVVFQPPLFGINCAYTNKLHYINNCIINFCSLVFKMT